MKKVGKIMEELGFRPEGSDKVKKAFIKNLIKQSNQTSYKKNTVKKVPEFIPQVEEAFEQLSFFDKKKTS